MTLIKQFVDALLENKHTLFHFTDSRNIESIKKFGLIPTNLLGFYGVEAVTGGDQDSLGIDRYRGFDGYVRLSFCRQHPMSHVARQRGNIETVRILRVCPTVLLRDGVQFADRIATANDAVIAPPADLIPSMDFEAIYKFMDWKVPENRARRTAAEKWEAMIPGVISVERITGL